MSQFLPVAKSSMAGGYLGRSTIQPRKSCVHFADKMCPTVEAKSQLASCVKVTAVGFDQVKR
jgi:hypothetical protein